ncbi:unnamed protein product, partial [Musa acuminata subsp. burmannicoides]
GDLESPQRSEAAHGAPTSATELPSQSADVALWYANQRKRDCALVHSTLSYGENILWGGRGRAGRPGTPSPPGRRSSATTTTEATPSATTTPGWCGGGRSASAAARPTAAGGDTYVACEYDPHGNVIGGRPQRGVSYR